MTKRSFRDSIEERIFDIQVRDKSVNAFTTLSLERARSESDELDQLSRSGSKLPPLAGVPYAVKNLFDIEGVTTVAGSKVLQKNLPASRDAVLINRLKSAGAILLGALNMDEFAYGFTTENSHYGATHNPHKIGYMSGGSSGGSAAAVAAEMVPLSLGSDTNGSIRVPASFCGVWGLKPTFGRLSRAGAYPFVDSIDHVGHFSKTVDLLSLSYDCMQGPDESDRFLGLYVFYVGSTMKAKHLALLFGVLPNTVTTMISKMAKRIVAVLKDHPAAKIQFPVGFLPPLHNLSLKCRLMISPSRFSASSDVMKYRVATSSHCCDPAGNMSSIIFKSKLVS